MVRMVPNSQEKPDWVQIGFIRQRRNLIVISLALLFYKASELSISKLNVFGTELVIRHPGIVTGTLWIAYVYWLWRYYVYFHDLGDKGFDVELRDRLSVLVDRWSNRKFSTDLTWRVQLGLEADDQLRRTQVGNVDLQTALNAPHDWQLLDAAPVGMPSFREIPVQPRLGLFPVGSGNLGMKAETHGHFIIGGLNACSLNSWAGVYVLFHTRILSEYFLPYLIAAVPPLYALYRMLIK